MRCLKYKYKIITNGKKPILITSLGLDIDQRILAVNHSYKNFCKICTGKFCRNNWTSKFVYNDANIYDDNIYYCHGFYLNLDMIL